MNERYNYQPQNATLPTQSQFFPQPQGNVYMINNSFEFANVPVGSGISAAICPQESLLYIKSFQNGNPMFLAYRLIPYLGQNQTQTQPVAAQPQKEKQPVSEDANHSEILTAINGLSQKIEKLVTKGEINNEF